MSLLQNIISFIGLFCKKTYDFKEPTNRSHPIPESYARIYSCESYTNDAFGNHHSDLQVSFVQNIISFIGLFCQNTNDAFGIHQGDSSSHIGV